MTRRKGPRGFCHKARDLHGPLPRRRRRRSVRLPANLRPAQLSPARLNPVLPKIA